MPQSVDFTEDVRPAPTPRPKAVAAPALDPAQTLDPAEALTDPARRRAVPLVHTDDDGEDGEEQTHDD